MAAILKMAAILNFFYLPLTSSHDGLFLYQVGFNSSQTVFSKQLGQNTA